MKGASVAVQKAAEKHPELKAEVDNYNKAVQNLMSSIKLQEGIMSGLDLAKRLLHAVRNQNIGARDA